MPQCTLGVHFLRSQTELSKQNLNGLSKNNLMQSSYAYLMKLRQQICIIKLSKRN